MVRKIICLLLVGVLAGCAGLSLARYQEIEKGMTREEVKGILGEPWVEAPKIYVYQGQGLETATIFFDEEGRVVKKKWDEGVYEEYPATGPGY
ncbi:MAG: hypothetical protein AMS15_01655 [Planctomycetes bacterium DG_23]|nr:MAG: hypothetical protein AMS15_01655 [Planctomycetes bacterium DG_23]